MNKFWVYLFICGVSLVSAQPIDGNIDNSIFFTFIYSIKSIFSQSIEDCLQCLPELAPAIASCIAEYGSDGIAISVCVSEIMSPNECYTQEIVCCVLETYFNIECQSE